MRQNLTLSKLMTPKNKSVDLISKHIEQNCNNISGSTQEKYFLIYLISKLGTCFTTPEEVVIKQGEDSHSMFFIS